MPSIWRASAGVAGVLPAALTMFTARSTSMWLVAMTFSPFSFTSKTTLSSMPTRMWPPRAREASRMGRWPLPMPKADQVEPAGMWLTRYIRFSTVAGMPPSTPRQNWK